MPAVDTPRERLYAELRRVLGPEHARTLMDHLSRHPSDEALTKHDLAAFERRLESRFADISRRFERIDRRFERIDQRFEQIDRRLDHMDRRFDRMEDRMDRMQRFYVGTTVWSMMALTAMFSFVVAIIT